MTIAVTLSDGQSASSVFVQNFSASINPTNSLPVISSIPDQLIPKNRLSVIPFSVGDAETPAASLEVTVASSNPLVLPETALTIDGSGGERTLTLDPINGRAGSSIVTVQVSDGASQATTSFRATVGN